MIFPDMLTDVPVTRLVLSQIELNKDLPDVIKVVNDTGVDYENVDAFSAIKPAPLLAQHAQGSFSTPGLRGQRITSGYLNENDARQTGEHILYTGQDWSPRFLVTSIIRPDEKSMTIKATDEFAGLSLTTVMESILGGSMRIRHTLTNEKQGSYALEALEVQIPLDEEMTEYLDFSGYATNERLPQRHQIKDGSWVREFRRGQPGFDGPIVVVGTPGFGFANGNLVQAQLAWSGNSVFRVERSVDEPASIRVGELLLPGEITLECGESYTMPWVMLSASLEGLDGLAQSNHAWQRSLPAHPKKDLVTFNVWEAVGFNQNWNKLSRLASLAAEVGTERFVLDDGWFHLRRSDKAGLGDWWVDDLTWSQGLTPLINQVHELGMQFGLWLEPEMVNPDSDLYRSHPSWVLQASERQPLLQRNQQVLDLTNPQVYDYLFNLISAVLADNNVDFVKWDHNRDLLEAGSNLHNNAPAVHRQVLSFYRLLDDLRNRFPNIYWESCAAGGGRIDNGVIEHVSRFWTSDMTDALSRQDIQRWTCQYIAPEYLGAHVSGRVSQQTGRSFSLNFRAATAVLFAFGIEWDLTQAEDHDLNDLKEWVDWYKSERSFLHSERFVRLDLQDNQIRAQGVVARDGTRAVIQHVQCGMSSSKRGLRLRVPGLNRSALYRLSWIGPNCLLRDKGSSLFSLPDKPLSGALLEDWGLLMPWCRPQTIRMIEYRQI